MNFRKFLNQQILNIVVDNRNNITYHHKKTEIFFFLLGCYPSNEKNLNHEYPELAKACQDKTMNVNLVLIDPNYLNFLENNEVRDRIYNYGLSVQVYENIIELDEYDILVEFCHFISNFNCLSVIMDMTGIPRKQYYLADHQTHYLYITPSDCDMNTQDTIYNPIILSEMVKNSEDVEIEKYYFYRIEKEEELYEHFDYSNPDKMKYLVTILKLKMKEVENFYLKTLTYMQIKPREDKFHLELNYDKTYGLFHILKQNLYHRMNHYNYHLDRLFIEFGKSDYENLEVFIKKKIYFIFISALNYQCQGDIEKIKLSSDSILFDSIVDIRRVLESLKN